MEKRACKRIPAYRARDYQVHIDRAISKEGSDEIVEILTYIKSDPVV
jgi:hypothetical protein